MRKLLLSLLRFLPLLLFAGSCFGQVTKESTAFVYKLTWESHWDESIPCEYTLPENPYTGRVGNPQMVNAVLCTRDVYKDMFRCFNTLRAAQDFYYARPNNIRLTNWKLFKDSEEVPLPVCGESK